MLRLGTSFALTVAIAYALCTVVFWMWPQAAAIFMSGAALFDFGSFVLALIGITAWAFAVGTLFGWLSARFAGAH